MDMETAKPAPRLVSEKSQRYQSNKAEREEVVRIDTTPHELALAVLQPVRIIKDADA